MAQLWAIQNPTKSLFSHQDLIWRDFVRHGKGNAKRCKQARTPTSRIEEFLIGERLLHDGVEWDKWKNVRGADDGHPNPRQDMHKGHI